MSLRVDRILRLNSKPFQNVLTHKRFRHKKKWAVNKKKKPPTELALEHFDTYYKPVYSHLWPSMRLALLSQRKYGALVNNFSDVENTIIRLIESGADDMFEGTRDLIVPSVPIAQDEQDASSPPKTAELPAHESEFGPSDIYDFMPVKRILSEKEDQLELEVAQNIYTEPSDEDVEVITDDPLIVPSHLKVFVRDKGDVRLFQQSSRGSAGFLDYYLLDAGSILPALALGLFPDCSVLDLCAAPGGKTLAILQTMLPEHVTCVDHSYSRMGRLHNIINTYLPKQHREGRVTCLHNDGVHWCQHTNETYDRVLVDVPCFTDRHVLHNEESNMFRGGSIHDRLQIQETQLNLLFWGIQKCKPGGNIVYSTCTLSPPQNDGIIHRAIQKLQQETDIEVVVQNTRHLTERFSHCLNFYTDSRFGQLVLPNMTANFGPTYFCKLKRLN